MQKQKPKCQNQKSLKAQKQKVISQNRKTKKPKVKKIAIGIGKAKDYPGIKKIMEMNKKGKKRFKDGGSAMKPVDKSKNPGLAKLPTQVRNKMGYMKKGGRVGMGKAMRGGGCVR